MNLDNQKLKAIQSSKAYCMKELEKTTDEHIRQKIEHYINGLTEEEETLLKQIGDD